ncbi:MAG TPA: hypothetical protein VL588_08115 [Bdellovibrionota bacterium]|nr:hypothetical protein [Bdellovibrionota bacterium]
MKKQLIVIAGIIGLLALAPAVRAEETKPAKKKNATREQIHSTQSASTHTVPTAGNTRTGIGITAGGTFIGTSGVSTYHIFDEANALQTYFGIAGVNGVFRFGMGAQYKHTVAGSQRAGLHIGGGLGLGTTAGAAAAGSVFFIEFTGNVGIHFTVGHDDNVLISVDAGPGISIVNGAADFAIKSPTDDTLGLSVHYLL